MATLTTTTYSASDTLEHVSPRAHAALASPRPSRRSQRRAASRDRRQEIGFLAGREFSRRRQRFANLISLLEAAPNVDPVLDETPAREVKFSVFSSLFDVANLDKLKRWLDFSQMSEEEQYRMLDTSEHEKCLGDNDDSDSDGFVEVNGETMTSETQSVPLTATQCYLRIEPSTRRFLRRRRLPPGPLIALEADLIERMESSADYVHTVAVENAFDRDMAMTVCQFHGLHCVPSDSHMLHLLISSPHYTPPPVTLTQFLCTQ